MERFPPCTFFRVFGYYSTGAQRRMKIFGAGGGGILHATLVIFGLQGVKKARKFYRARLGEARMGHRSKPTTDQIDQTAHTSDGPDTSDSSSSS